MNAPDEDQTGCDVDKDADHDEKVEDVPDAAHIRIRGKEKSIRDDLDDELHQEREPERGLGHVEPGPAHAPMLGVVISAIQGRRDRRDGDARDDGEEQDELEDGVRDRGGAHSIDALAARRANEQLAEPPQRILLGKNPERLVERGVNAHEIGFHSLAFVQGVARIFRRRGAIVNGGEQIPNISSRC